MCITSKKNLYKFHVSKSAERDRLGNPGVYRRIILKCNLHEYDRREIESPYFGHKAVAGSCEHGYKPLGGGGNSCLDEELLASQKGLW